MHVGACRLVICSGRQRVTSAGSNLGSQHKEKEDGWEEEGHRTGWLKRREVRRGISGLRLGVTGTLGETVGKTVQPRAQHETKAS